MSASVKTKSFDLSGIEDTAWLTIYARSRMSRKGISWFKDSFAEWFIDHVGEPPFAKDLNALLFKGVSARSACIDEMVAEELATAQAAGKTIDVWEIGCGFDSRWGRLGKDVGKGIREYREFDTPDLMEKKAAIIASSPFRNTYKKVIRVSDDFFAGLPESIPASKNKVVLVLEGVFHYLGEETHRRFLEAAARRLPNAVLIADLYNASGINYAKRKGHRSYTGSDDVKFTWGPEDIPQWFEELGVDWVSVKTVKQIIDMKKRVGGIWRFIPIPGFMAKKAMIVKAVVKKDEVLELPLETRGNE